MTVLVMGYSNDAHAQHVYQTLNDRQIDCELFDTSKFPLATSISWQPQQATGRLTLANGRALAFSQISAVYWRTINRIKLADMDAGSRFLAHRDSMSTLRTLFKGTKARWVNSYQNVEDHKEKPYQLSIADQLGVNIPKTLISNDPQQIIEFVGTLKRAIFKPVYGGAHTDFISKAMLAPERLEKVTKLCPVTIQEFIRGTNIRTYVIGDKVFSGEIKSGSVDFREDGEAELSALELPSDIKQQSLDIAKAFDMQWTAIDWRLDDDGTYYFLEANPSPMFIHFERQTGHPITNTLVDLLISKP